RRAINDALAFARHLRRGPKVPRDRDCQTDDRGPEHTACETHRAPLGREQRPTDLVVVVERYDAPMELPSATRAMRIGAPHSRLTLETVALPRLGSHQVLLEVSACGVCRTDLHVLDGDLPNARYPVTPGHEIVGRVLAVGGPDVPFEAGERVGVPWL